MDISLVFFVEKDLMILFNSSLIVLKDKSHDSHKYFPVDELFPVWSVTKWLQQFHSSLSPTPAVSLFGDIQRQGPGLQKVLQFPPLSLLSAYPAPGIDRCYL